MARALKPGARLAFTYHHNRLEAYAAVGVAILDAGLVCTAALPCPAEMGGSMHIHGTQSSIMDTILVCRSAGSIPRRWLCATGPELLALGSTEQSQLETTGRALTLGDMRCLLFGHLARLAIWALHPDWDGGQPTERKLSAMGTAMGSYGNPEGLAHTALGTPPPATPPGPLYAVLETPSQTTAVVTFGSKS